MSRLTSFLGGAGCGFGAGFVWKFRGAFANTAQQHVASRIATIGRAQAAVASAVSAAPLVVNTTALESALETMASDAGAAWQKLRDLQHDILATNDRSRTSFEQAFQAFAAWPELLKKTIASHPPPPALRMEAPAQGYPEVPNTPELLALERDLAAQTAKRAQLELAAEQNESAAAALLSAAGELRQSLPQQGN